VENRYAALVRGPSAIFPRGILWLIPVWYAVIALALVTSKRAPSWYDPAAQAGLLLAAFTLLAVLATIRNNAFVADDIAIWLGLRAGAARRVRRRREVRQVPWPAIQHITIASRFYGARLDVLIDPAAQLVRRPGAIKQIAAGTLLLILPVSCMVRSPALLRLHAGKPGYRIPLYEVTADEVRRALAALAPGTVLITVQPRLRERAYRRLRRARA
jgi:hypothetical protein